MNPSSPGIAICSVSLTGMTVFGAYTVWGLRWGLTLLSKRVSECTCFCLHALAHICIPHVDFCLPFLSSAFSKPLFQSQFPYAETVSITEFLTQVQWGPLASGTRPDTFDVGNVVLPCTSKYQLSLGCLSDCLKPYFHITFPVLHDGHNLLLGTSGEKWRLDDPNSDPYSFTS